MYLADKYQISERETENRKPAITKLNMHMQNKVQKLKRNIFKNS